MCPVQWHQEYSVNAARDVAGRAPDRRPAIATAPAVEEPAERAVSDTAGPVPVGGHDFGLPVSIGRIRIGGVASRTIRASGGYEDLRNE